MSSALALGQISSHSILYHAYEKAVCHYRISPSKDSEVIVLEDDFQTDAGGGPGWCWSCRLWVHFERCWRTWLGCMWHHKLRSLSSPYNMFICGALRKCPSCCCFKFSQGVSSGLEEIQSPSPPYAFFSSWRQSLINKLYSDPTTAVVKSDPPHLGRASPAHSEAILDCDELVLPVSSYKAWNKFCFIFSPETPRPHHDVISQVYCTAIIWYLAITF